MKRSFPTKWRQPSGRNMPKRGTTAALHSGLLAGMPKRLLSYDRVIAIDPGDAERGTPVDRPCGVLAGRRKQMSRRIRPLPWIRDAGQFTAPDTPIKRIPGNPVCHTSRERGYLREQRSVRYPVKPGHIINTLFLHTFSNENAHRYVSCLPHGHKRDRIESEIPGRA